MNSSGLNKLKDVDFIQNKRAKIGRMRKIVKSYFMIVGRLELKALEIGNK